MTGRACLSRHGAAALRNNFEAHCSEAQPLIGGLRIVIKRDEIRMTKPSAPSRLQFQMSPPRGKFVPGLCFKLSGDPASSCFHCSLRHSCAREQSFEHVFKDVMECSLVPYVKRLQRCFRCPQWFASGHLNPISMAVRRTSFGYG